jgi:DNA-binding HxlR family transcriptional regulator
MRRKSLSNTSCPIGRALDEIGDWWTLLIVREAFHGARRFRDFEQRLAISKNILTIRLNLLLDARIFESRAGAEGRTHKEYHLTHKGTRLWLVLVALRQWGEDHLFEDGETLGVLLDHSGRPVQRLQVLSEDGVALAQPDTEVKFEVRGDAVTPSSSSPAV